MTAAADTATALPDALGPPLREFLSRPQHLLIGAERLEAADGRTFATLDPSSGREIARSRRPAPRTSSAPCAPRARRSRRGRGRRCRRPGASG